MNILLVDDEANSRLHLADFLHKLGHTVTEASDGRQALEILQSRDFDLLLTDNRMPGMSGLELLKSVHDLPACKDISKVILTAYGDMENTVQAIRAGACDYLLKPLDIDELVAMLERVAALQQAGKTAASKLSEPTGKSNLDSSRAEKKLPGYMRKKFTPNSSLNEIGVYSLSMHRAYELAQKLHVNRSIPVLIEGETGTGKEVIARYIHNGE